MVAGWWRFSLLPLGPAWWVSSMMVGRLVAGQGPVPGREQSSGSAADWSECGNMLERGTEAATAPPPCNNNSQNLAPYSGDTKLQLKHYTDPSDHK